MRSTASSCSAEAFPVTDSCVARSVVSILVVLLAFGCELEPKQIKVPVYVPPNPPDSFVCRDENSRACVGTKHYTCSRNEEFLQAHRVDCAEQEQVCIVEFGCSVCVPDTRRCVGEAVELCADGTKWEPFQVCNTAEGFRCDLGYCDNMCDLAAVERSYEGCEFYAVDLDNAALSEIDDASSQQFAIAVSNPQSVTTRVVVEINRAPLGEEPDVVQVASVLVPPGDLEYLKLDRREVDGSSADGLNDGTHTAVTSNAYRVTSKHPIIAYQFNPFANVNVFSNDASLLLPVSAVGTDYTVVGWPQTIANSTNPEQDFDSSRTDEDLRAFLTVVGTFAPTNIRVTLGPDIVKMVGAGSIPERLAGESFDVTIGPFDVVNLETQGFNADFTGTTISADHPIAVFVGSEASDVPIFGTYATRQCCADHLEEQLFANSSLGSGYIVARMPNRTRALNGAFPDGLVVAVAPEPEWVRIVSVTPGMTSVRTTLPPPNDSFTLSQHQGEILQVDQDTLIEADRPVAVLQALASQGVTGVPRAYPGGDPSIIAVSPIQQYRTKYTFLTPDKYGFDFVIISAPSEARVRLDGEELIVDDVPEIGHCTRDAADGLPRGDGDPTPDYVIYRCPLSFPEVTPAPNSIVLDGEQNDGVHTVESTLGVGVVVYGFDRFVSYAYAAGLNQKVLN